MTPTSVKFSNEIGAVLIGVESSPPDVVPRNTLYVTPCVVLEPQLTSTECWPEPLSETVSGEFVALLATVMLAPVTAIPWIGSNVTVSVTDWPGVRTVPLEIPETLKPAPAVITLDMVTSEFPLFVIDVVCDALV